jgi:hypothetical protein
VAGCAAGSIFAVLVAISAIVGVLQGSPVFFPMWFAVLPGAAIVFSLIGQRHVENSEGTRVGAKLARVGMWLAIVSSLMYFSYYYVTGWTIQGQADAFLREKGPDAGFFPSLIDAAKDPKQLNVAFLLTKPPNARSGNPASDGDMRTFHDMGSVDGMPATWLQFREGPWGRFFYKDLAKDAEIIPMNVEDWKYEEKSYKVYRVYRIKTKEIAAYDVRLAIASIEPEGAGQTRKWFVNLNESRLSDTPGFTGTKQLTPLGEGVARLRQSAITWLERKANAWNEGAPFTEFNDKDFNRTAWEALLIDKNDLPSRRKLVTEVFADARAKRIAMFKVYSRADDPGKWEQVQGKIRFEILGHAMLSPGDNALPANVIALFSIESVREIDPARFQDLPDWRLVGIDIQTVTMFTPKGP